MTRPTTLDLVREALPLQVDNAETAGPSVGIWGEGWSLSLLCPWELVGPGTRTTWESKNLVSDWQILLGRTLEGVTARDDDAVDPTFHFNGAITLSVRADSDLDPWTLRVPGLVVVGTKAM